MITRYNNYITKDAEIIKEKVEISIKGLLDKAKENTEQVRKTIIHNSITADKQPVKIGGEYYAVVYLATDPSFQRVSKVKIDTIIEKRKADSDKTYKVFKYKKISIDSPLEDTKLRDYKLLLTKKSEDKLSSGEITGFYLYKEEIKNKEIPEIIKRYGYVESEEPKSDVEVKAGNVYEITNSKGDRVDLTVYSVDKNGILTGYDYDNKQKYDNYKVKNIKDPKLKGSAIDKYEEKIKNLHIDSWKNKPEYKNLQKVEDKIKFIESKKEEINKLKTKLKNFSGNEEINKLAKSASRVSQYMDSKIEKLKNPKADAKQGKLPLKDKKSTEESDTNPNPTEESDTNVDDKDEQKTVDDMKKGEEKADTVQAQPEKKKVKKKVKKPLKQKQRPASEPPSDTLRLPTGAPDYAAVEKLNYPKK